VCVCVCLCVYVCVCVCVCVLYIYECVCVSVCVGRSSPLRTRLPETTVSPGAVLKCPQSDFQFKTKLKYLTATVY